MGAPEWDEMQAFEQMRQDISAMAKEPFMPIECVVTRVCQYLRGAAENSYYLGIWPGWNEEGERERMKDEFWLRINISDDRDGAWLETEAVPLSKLILSSNFGDIGETVASGDLERLEKTVAILRAKAEAA